MSMIGLGIIPFLMYYLYTVVPLAPLVYLFLKRRASRDGAASPTPGWERPCCCSTSGRWPCTWR